MLIGDIIKQKGEIMSKHTPGEWSYDVQCAVEPNNSLCTIYYNGNDQSKLGSIASVQIWRSGVQGTVSENIANARLIASAPELLEGCKMALSYLPARDGKRIPGDPDGDVQLTICNKLKQAIAKAEG